MQAAEGTPFDSQRGTSCLATVRRGGRLCLHFHMLARCSAANAAALVRLALLWHSLAAQSSTIKLYYYERFKVAAVGRSEKVAKVASSALQHTCLACSPHAAHAHACRSEQTLQSWSVVSCMSCRSMHASSWHGACTKLQALLACSAEMSVRCCCLLPSLRRHSSARGILHLPPSRTTRYPRPPRLSSPSSTASGLLIVC